VKLFRFEDPPPAKDRRGFEETAQKLKEKPRTWAVVAVYSDRSNAGTLSQRIRQGRNKAWQAPGDFDSVVRTVDGQHRVYARYLGDGGLPDDR
jgi:hypothetical protein